MDAVGSWFLGKKAESEINSIAEGVNNFAEETANSVTNLWQGLVGKVQKPLPEFLKAFDLPPGIFPKNISKYSFTLPDGADKDDDPSGTLTVSSPYDMEVKLADGTLVQYKKVVSGILVKGRFEDIFGIKMKGTLGYTEITSIFVDSPPKDKIYFQARMKKSKPINLFASQREGVEVLSIK